MNLFQQPSTPLIAGGTSGPIAVPASVRRLEFNINVTALSGTTPSITVFVEGQDDNGVWYALYAPSAISTVSDTAQSIGPGMQTNTVIPETVRVRWTIGGSAVPTVTCTISLVGQAEAQ
jgi:hypothetical protein